MQSSSQIVATSKLTPSFLQAGCPSCRPTNSVKALKVNELHCLPLTYYYVYFNFTLPRGQALFTRSIVEVQCTSRCRRNLLMIFAERETAYGSVCIIFKFLQNDMPFQCFGCVSPGRGMQPAECHSN